MKSLIPIWSVITMLQDSGICVDVAKKEHEVKRITRFLVKQLPIDRDCAIASAERAFDSMASVLAPEVKP